MIVVTRACSAKILVLQHIRVRVTLLAALSAVGRGWHSGAMSDARVPVETITPREVPLGGPRAMTVRRTLPQRARTLIGAWCFVDHYGPDDVSLTGGMHVPPHPHTGLQTVSWLFAGEIEHRDSLGSHAPVRPGELNLMTAGHGIATRRCRRPSTAVLHGVQLWVALPDGAPQHRADFQHHVPEPVRPTGPHQGVPRLARGGTSPVRTFTPLLGAEIVLDPGASVELAVDAASSTACSSTAGTSLSTATLLARRTRLHATGHPR